MVHALHAETGQERWSFSAGGRIDSPPTIHGGDVIFGCADGFVYCLRLADGTLRWRFLAAPADRRLISFCQLESVWPVTGSVLIQDNTAYCIAGRSSYVDGGMIPWRLDATTGEPIGSTRLYDRDPATGRQPEERIADTEMPGALPDVLASDGENLYLRDKRVDLEGNSLPHDVPHLYSSAGLLDDHWWHRSKRDPLQGIDFKVSGIRPIIRLLNESCPFAQRGRRPLKDNFQRRRRRRSEEPSQSRYNG